MRPLLKGITTGSFDSLQKKSSRPTGPISSSKGLRIPKIRKSPFSTGYDDFSELREIPSHVGNVERLSHNSIYDLYLEGEDSKKPIVVSHMEV